MKLPDHVAWLDVVMQAAYTVDELADAEGTGFDPLFTEAQLREALAQQESENEANERNLCQLTDELAESRREAERMRNAGRTESTSVDIDGLREMATQMESRVGSSDDAVFPAKTVLALISVVDELTEIANHTRQTCYGLTAGLRATSDEAVQLQEQNTYLDKVASELDDLCDRQAKRLASNEAVMWMVLEALNGLFGIPEQWTGQGGGGVSVWRLGGSDQPRAAIKALEEQLK